MIKEKPSEKTEKALEHFDKINPLNDHAVKISQKRKCAILKYHAVLLQKLGPNKNNQSLIYSLFEELRSIQFY